MAFDFDAWAKSLPLGVLRELADKSGEVAFQDSDLTELVEFFIKRNPMVRDIVKVACYLAAGPSADELDALFYYARRCWRDEEIAVRALEEYHRGALPKDHRACLPRPSFAFKGKA